MRALALVSLAAVGAFLACATAPIGTYEKGDDASGDNGASGDGTTTTPGNPTLTVSIGGTGTGTVAADGLTCSGTTCTGSYATGTKVTLTATAGTGSTFVGWAGACTGTATCDATVTGATVVTATFAGGGGTSTLAGTWSGTYTHSQMNAGCTFKNAGNLSVALVPADAGTTVQSTAQIDGLELRQNRSCALVTNQATGSDSADLMSATPTTLSGTWNFAIPNSGELPLPFTATIAGTTMTGQWTCTGCTGTFTLTRK